MASHTAAPWTVDHGADQHPGIEAHGVSIVVLGWKNEKEDDWGGVRGLTDEEALANAHLIAASPLLLEACQAAKEYLVPDLVEPGRTVFWKLVAAIKAATGAQP